MSLWIALGINVLALVVAARSRLPWWYRVLVLVTVPISLALWIPASPKSPPAAAAMPTPSPASAELRTRPATPREWSREVCSEVMAQKHACLRSGRIWIWSDVCAGRCSAEIP